MLCNHGKTTHNLGKEAPTCLEAFLDSTHLGAQHPQNTTCEQSRKNQNVAHFEQIIVCNFIISIFQGRSMLDVA